MFEELENSKEKLGINSCGITITTMEDVFLNVSNISDIKYLKNNENHSRNGTSVPIDDIYGNSNQLRKQNLHSQLFALLEKRFHYSKRHWGMLITQLIVPFMLICLCFYSIKGGQDAGKPDYNFLKLDINQIYGSTDGFYYSTTNQILTEKLSSVLKENNVKAEQVKDPSQYILTYGGNKLLDYQKYLLVGGSVDELENKKINLTAWYNGEPYHAMPMSLLMMHTSILRYVGSEKANISLTNAPLSVIQPEYRTQRSGLRESIMASVFIPLALGFMSATAVLVPIHERATKAQLLQLMTGLPHSLYWLGMFLWDIMLYFISSLFLIIPFAIFFDYVFFGSHSNAIGTALFIIWLYGFSSIPMSYLISLFFKKGNTGFTVIIGITCIIGVAASSILTSVTPSLAGRNKDIAEGFINFFRLFPPFAVSSGMSKVFSTAFINTQCDSIPIDQLNVSCSSQSMSSEDPLFPCCKGICGNMCFNETYFITMDEKGCGPDIIFLFMEGIACISFLIFSGTSYFSNISRLIKQKYTQLRKTGFSGINRISTMEDSDVLAEEQRVHNLYDTHNGPGNEALMALDLSKIFKNFYAVDHLSFCIHQEECFGLLGVNGAGKTTTFRMLTGDTEPSEGNAFTTNCALISDTKKFQSYLGYCPQFDALIDRLTGREILTLFARLRGLSGNELKERVNKLLIMTDLEAHADKQSRFYSGGNKRKLSVGMALIGSPPLILLDEPTAGVDPVSRRKIWNILAQARNNTKAAIILTTHSMEESEALCSRLAIMVNGRFRCLGSIQQLKAKFGKGYTIIIKMKKETADNQQSIDAIKVFIGTSLKHSELKDDNQNMLQYHVIDPNVKLSYLFKFLENMKEQFDLEDYLISDTSLEQIFLTFARAQRGVTE